LPRIECGWSDPLLNIGKNMEWSEAVMQFRRKK
jgi:hypothetical protein